MQLATHAGVDSVENAVIASKEEYPPPECVVDREVPVVVQVLEEVEKIVGRAEHQWVGVEDVTEDVVDGDRKVVIQRRRLDAQHVIDDGVGVVARIAEGVRIARIEIQIEATPQIELLSQRRRAVGRLLEEIPCLGHSVAETGVVDPSLAGEITYRVDVDLMVEHDVVDLPQQAS